MMHTLVQLAADFGLLIVFANVLLMHLGLPLPTVPTLIVSGTLAADGHFSLSGLLFVTVVAGLIGDGVWYGIGRLYGLRVMRLLCRMSLSPDSCVRQTELRFERWGLSTLLIAKFVPGLSLIVAPMSGALRFRWLAFLAFDAVGILLWSGTAIGAGMLLHPDIEKLSQWMMQLGNTAVLIVLVLLGLYLTAKWWQRRRFNRAMQMERIHVEDLLALMRGGKQPIVIDVRSANMRALAAQAIPGALNVILDQWQQLLPQLPFDRDIIVYCACPNEASAAVLARRLADKGYHRALPLLGGIDAWVAAGYPTETIEAAPAAAMIMPALTVPAE